MLLLGLNRRLCHVDFSGTHFTQGRLPPIARVKVTSSLECQHAKLGKLNRRLQPAPFGNIDLHGDESVALMTFKPLQLSEGFLFEQEENRVRLGNLKEVVLLLL